MRTLSSAGTPRVQRGVFHDGLPARSYGHMDLSRRRVLSVPRASSHREPGAGTAENGDAVAGNGASSRRPFRWTWGSGSELSQSAATSGPSATDRVLFEWEMTSP